MSDKIFEFEVPELLKLHITGRNDDRVERYLNRLEVTKDEERALVDYSSSIPGLWLGGEEISATFRDLPRFFESRYFVRCDFASKAKVTSCRVIHPMAAVSDQFDFSNGTLFGTLDFINSPGKFELVLDFVADSRPRKLVLKWIVASEKLDVVRDYADIKATIERNSPGIVQAFLSKTNGTAGYSDTTSNSDHVWYSIFKDVIDTYKKACDWIVNRPHLKYRKQVQYLHADKIRKWTPSVANRYKETPNERKEITTYRSEIIVPEIDTIENRFVKFTLQEISKRLLSFANECSKHVTVSGDFVKAMKAQVSVLDNIARKPFFRQIGRFTGFRQESLALQRKQGYAEVYTTWLKLKQALDATKEGIDVAHRPISALYEFWCFLKMAEVLRGRFKDPITVIGQIKSLGDVFEDGDQEKELSKMEYVFTGGDDRAIRLVYQQSYTGSDSGHLSYLNTQRPDIVLTIEGKDETYTYLFDAKYRVNVVGNDGIDMTPAETINDMHRYRDAILYRQQDGEKKLSRQIIGAYVLYPGRPNKSYDYAANIQHENIGAIPLLPGEKGSEALVSFIDEILGKDTPVAHLDSVIPTRGTTMVVGEAISESEILDEKMDVPIHNQVIDKKICPIKADGRRFEGVKYARLFCEGRAEVIVKLGAMLQNGQQCDLNAVFGGFEYNHDKFYFYQVETRVK